MARESFERLPAWRGAMKLARLAHRLAGTLPADEKSGLAAGMKKAALGVSVKVAESDSCEDADAAIRRLNSCEPALRELMTTALLAYQLKMLGGFQVRKLRGTVERVRGLLAAEVTAWEDSREPEQVSRPEPAEDGAPDLKLRRAA